jgi:hypothetical protein
MYQFRASASGQEIEFPNNVGQVIGIDTDGKLSPQVGGGGGSVPVSTGLPQYATVGSGVYIGSRGRMYFAVPSGTGEIAGTGNDWQGNAYTSDPSLLNVTNWYIAGTTGDDNAAGDAAHPIKTGYELEQRLGVRWAWGGSVNIYVLEDVESLNLDFSMTVGSGALISIIGVPTIVATGTVTSWTLRSGNTAPILTSGGITDWATQGLTQSRLRVTSGVRLDNVMWVSPYANPYGGGLNTISTTTKLVRPDLSTSNLTAGDAFAIETSPRIKHLQIDCSGIELATNSVPTVKLNALAITALDIVSLNSARGSVVALGCDIVEYRVLASKSNIIRNVHFYACRVGSESLSNVKTAYCGMWQPTQLVEFDVPVGSSWTSVSDVLYGEVLHLHVGTAVDATDIGVIAGAIAPAHVIVDEGAVLYCNTLWGTGGNAGLHVHAGARVLHNSACTITGTLGDIRVGGSVAPIYVSWAATGGIWRDGANAGTGTLGAGGLGAVTGLPYFDTTKQSLVLQYRDASASAGVLSAPVASRTGTGFTAKGAAADTTSTFDWSITALGYNQIIALTT